MPPELEIRTMPKVVYDFAQYQITVMGVNPFLNFKDHLQRTRRESCTTLVEQIDLGDASVVDR